MSAFAPKSKKSDAFSRIKDRQAAKKEEQRVARLSPGEKAAERAAAEKSKK